MLNFWTLKQILPSSKTVPSYVPSTFAATIALTKKQEEYESTPFSKTRVGIEVEVEQIDPSWLSEEPIWWWKYANDSSLRNNGIEFQSPGPLANAANVGRALCELRELLRKRKIYDFSFRTGIHVHLCLMEFDLPRFLNVLLGYVLLEPYLFEAYCPQRKHSNFCVPIGAGGVESGFLGKMFSRFSKQYDEKSVSFDWSRGLSELWSSSGQDGTSPSYHNKYSAINLSRIREIGTIEFRHLPGNENFFVLRDWISTITSLMDFAYSIEFEKFMNQLTKANSESKLQRIIDRIVPPNLQKSVPKEVFASGLSQAKLLLARRNPIRETILLVKKSGKLMKVAEEISKRRKSRIKNYL